TGNGIYLHSTSNVSLSFMQLNGFQNFAILGSGVSGFSLLSSVVNGTNGTLTTTTDVAREGAISFNNLTGSATFTSDTLQGSAADNLKIINDTAGTLNALTVTNCTIQNNSTSVGEDGIYLRASSTANMTANITGSTFNLNRGDHVSATADGTAVMNVTI